jgi:hypothetical protein
MKDFATYQHVEGEPMNERDKMEVGSKFWNEGKWENYVAPFLPEDCSGMTFVDMGCNAGLFLKLAEDRGFSKVIGVDSNTAAVKRALRYRRRVDGKFKIIYREMERATLPMADYTVLANAHYYFPINDWLDYVDKLGTRTRYVIIVTAEKREKLSKASATLEDIRSYFRTWEEVGFIDELPLEGDPFPRRLWGLCFKSRHIDRVPIDSLDSGNHVQDKFYKELDGGVAPRDTKYGRILAKYRKAWPEGRLDKFLSDKVELYNDIKKNGLQRPIIITANNRIADGNHRCQMLKHLGEKTVLVRRI